MTVVGHGDAAQGQVGAMRGEQLATTIGRLLDGNAGATLAKVSAVGCASDCVLPALDAALRASGYDTHVRGHQGPVKVTAEGHRVAAHAGDPDALGNESRGARHPFIELRRPSSVAEAVRDATALRPVLQAATLGRG